MVGIRYCIKLVSEKEKDQNYKKHIPQDATWSPMQNQQGFSKQTTGEVNVQQEPEPLEGWQHGGQGKLDWAT
jgi:hypothetical protein